MLINLKSPAVFCIGHKDNIPMDPSKTERVFISASKISKLSP
jgi:hypothetical protein